jgi:hypothetical protein
MCVTLTDTHNCRAAPYHMHTHTHPHTPTVPPPPSTHTHTHPPHTPTSPHTQCTPSPSTPTHPPTLHPPSTHTHTYTHISTPTHCQVIKDIKDPFIRNWLDLLCFLLSGLPANGTIAAEVAYMFNEWYRPDCMVSGVVVCSRPGCRGGWCGAQGCLHGGWCGGGSSSSRL